MTDEAELITALADARRLIAYYESQYVGNREGCQHLKRLTVETGIGTEECVGCECDSLGTEAARLREERDSRIRYQDIVYATCNALDFYLGHSISECLTTDEVALALESVLGAVDRGALEHRDQTECWDMRERELEAEVARLTEERDELNAVIGTAESNAAQIVRAEARCDQQREDIRRLADMIAEMKERYGGQP